MLYMKLRKTMYKLYTKLRKIMYKLRVNNEEQP